MYFLALSSERTRIYDGTGNNHILPHTCWPLNIIHIKRNQGSLEKWLIPEQEKGKSKISLQHHFVMLKHKRTLKKKKKEGVEKAWKGLFQGLLTSPWKGLVKRIQWPTWRRSWWKQRAMKSDLDRSMGPAPAFTLFTHLPEAWHIVGPK